MIPSKIKIECFAKRCHITQICKFSFSLTHSCAQMQCCDCVVSGPSGVYCYWVALSLTRSKPHRKFMGYYGKRVDQPNERTPDMLERHYMEVWESIRRDPELCQQLVQLMRRRMQDCIDNGSRTKPSSSQNPPPTKIPIRPKTTADKNSTPGERVRLHVVVTKNWQVIVIVKTKCHCPPNLT